MGEKRRFVGASPEKRNSAAAADSRELAATAEPQPGRFLTSSETYQALIQPTPEVQSAKQFASN